MPKHDLTTMLADVLTPLVLHYPQAGYDPAELRVLAEDWCEDLAGYDLPLVLEAVKRARRRETFFPNVAKILAYCAEVEAGRPARDLLALEEENAWKTPEAIRRGAISAAMVNLSLQNPEGKDFFYLTDWTEKDALARRLLGDRYPDPLMRKNQGMESLQALLPSPRRQ